MGIQDLRRCVIVNFQIGSNDDLTVFTLFLRCLAFGQIGSEQRGNNRLEVVDELFLSVLFRRFDRFFLDRQFFLEEINFFFDRCFFDCFLFRFFLSLCRGGEDGIEIELCRLFVGNVVRDVFAGNVRTDGLDELLGLHAAQERKAGEWR